MGKKRMSESSESSHKTVPPEKSSWEFVVELSLENLISCGIPRTIRTLSLVVVTVAGSKTVAVANVLFSGDLFLPLVFVHVPLPLSEDDTAPPPDFLGLVNVAEDTVAKVVLFVPESEDWTSMAPLDMVEYPSSPWGRGDGVAWFMLLLLIFGTSLLFSMMRDGFPEEVLGLPDEPELKDFRTGSLLLLGLAGGFEMFEFFGGCVVDLRRGIRHSLEEVLFLLLTFPVDFLFRFSLRDSAAFLGGEEMATFPLHFGWDLKGGGIEVDFGLAFCAFTSAAVCVDMEAVLATMGDVDVAIVAFGDDDTSREWRGDFSFVSLI